MVGNLALSLYTALEDRGHEASTKMETKILFLLCLIPVIPALTLEDAPDFETEQMDGNVFNVATCFVSILKLKNL